MPPLTQPRVRSPACRRDGRHAPPGRTLLSSPLVRRFIPLLIIVLGALALYVDFWPGPTGLGSGSRFIILSNPDAGFGQQLQTKLGLDLQGGFEVTYQAVYEPGHAPTASQMEIIRSIMEQRINTTGAVEPIVETEGGDRVRIELPGAVNAQQVKDLVGQAGRLEFVPLPKDQYGTSTSPGPKTAVEGQAIDPSLTPLFDGSQLDAGGTRAALVNGKWVVNFTLKGNAQSLFATYTTDHVGEFFAIVLDGNVVSAPYIQGAITGGQGEISGSFNAQSAKNLATILQYGALPYPVKEVASDEIPATLGQTFLSQTMFAGALGIGLVLLFMLVYYRLPGVVADMALVYYGVVVLALFRIIPVTLTLAGVAGFVLSVGMAVDANILIFERSKEELRTGKTLVSAVEAGFNRAWNSILDSNVSSLITATILYLGGSSTIKGFALVLIIGVATSMFTAVTVSRTLLRFVVKQSFANRAALYGVSNDEFQARPLTARERREAAGRV
jgi:preprotein translocase subunit SecD